jgi:hypothetical protein
LWAREKPPLQEPRAPALERIGLSKPPDTGGGAWRGYDGTDATLIEEVGDLPVGVGSGSPACSSSFPKTCVELRTTDAAVVREIDTVLGILLHGYYGSVP